MVRRRSAYAALAPASSMNSGITHGAANSTTSPSHLLCSALWMCQRSHGLNGSATWTANTTSIAATRSQSRSARRLGAGGACGSGGGAGLQAGGVRLPDVVGRSVDIMVRLAASAALYVTSYGWARPPRIGKPLRHS